MTGGYLVPTKHQETPLACAPSFTEWASSSILKRKSPLGTFAINLGKSSNLVGRAAADEDEQYLLVVAL
jgi:hypothetical protein